MVLLQSSVDISPSSRIASRITNSKRVSLP
jgi:hypothetical protein